MDIKQFILEARQKGVSDEETLNYLRQKGIVDSSNQPPKPEPNGVQKVLGGLETTGKTLGKVGEAVLFPTLKALETVAYQPIRQAQGFIPGGATGKEEIKTPFGTIKNMYEQPLGETAFQLLDIATAAAPVEQIVKKPLTMAAEKLYGSALKARDVVKAGKVITKGKDVAKIGLNERVWLTGGGVEKVASKIYDFENILGQAIENAGKQGKTVSTADVVKYVDEAKSFFQNQANVAKASKAVQELNALKTGFVKKYGKNLPIEKAQEIKVATGQALKKYYNTMSASEIEGEKQLVRGLKEKIVEKAPIVGDINARLSNLYKFDQQLSKSSNRVKNLNLLGLPSKVGGAVAGPGGVIIGKLLEIADSAAVKSGVAIGLDKLATGGQTALKGVKVPLASLINHIYDELNKNK